MNAICREKGEITNVTFKKVQKQIELLEQL